MATEVEQLYLQLELINIEKQMLKLQMLKHRRQRRRSWGWPVRPTEARNGWIYNTGCEFTGVNLQPGWTNALDNFECQWASSPYTAIKTGKSNCQKLRSERTNHSPRHACVVRIFWRSGYGGGVHADIVATSSKWRWSINYDLNGYRNNWCYF